MSPDGDKITNLIRSALDECEPIPQGPQYIIVVKDGATIHGGIHFEWRDKMKPLSSLLLVLGLAAGCSTPKTVSHMGEPAPEVLFDDAAKALAGEP